MIQHVRRYLDEHRLAVRGEALWVAVSGGVDSMVLLHVLRELGHECHVAHVDHGLRGAASDADRAFVEEHCRAEGIPFHVHRVDVQGGDDGLSVQMAARELRYAWFRQLVKQGPAQLALAHHADDAIETLFIHLMQGMGTRGWGTIPVRSGPFIRPLLGLSRAEIERYAMEHDVHFREDASNADPKYLRNRLRHELLPLIMDMRPGAHDVLARNVELLRELGSLANEGLTRLVATVRPDPEGPWRIPYTVLHAAPHALLTRLLRTHRFHPDRIAAIVRAVQERSTGARFAEGEVEVWVERDGLTITRAVPELPVWSIASAEQVPSDAPLTIAASAGSAIDPRAGASVAWFDSDVAAFPWTLRPWRVGDRMRPRGLGGSKLISDILIDAKVDAEAKRRVYVLENASGILWCCGLRIAQGFAATPDAPHAWRCTWGPR